MTGDPTYYAKADEAVARSFELEPDDNFTALAASAAIAAARHDFADALARPTRRSRSTRATSAPSPCASTRSPSSAATTSSCRRCAPPTGSSPAPPSRPATPTPSSCAATSTARGALLRRTAEVRLACRPGLHAHPLRRPPAQAGPPRRGRPPPRRRARRPSRTTSPRSSRPPASRSRRATSRVPWRPGRRWSRASRCRSTSPSSASSCLHLGRTDEADAQFAVVRTTIDLLDASGVDTDLETALFEADHGSAERALTQAQAEWDQRRSVHVADALAWALHRNGRDREALPIARRATRLGSPEARFWIHRGTIEAALGMTADARTHLRRGLDARPRPVAVAARRRPSGAGRPGIVTRVGTGGRPVRTLVRLLLALGALLACLVVTAAPASAHPLGNFTVNRYTGILVSPDGVEVDHVVDLAEIPTAQLGDAIDDLPALADARVRHATGGLAVTAGGDGVPPRRSRSASASRRDGEGGLPVTRITCALSGAADIGAGDDHLRGRDRPGLGGLARGHRGRRRDDAAPAPTCPRAAPATGSRPIPRTCSSHRWTSRRRRSSSPRAAPRARCPAPGTTARPRPTAPGCPSRATALLRRQRLAGRGPAVLAALALGATHALSPGHGKTVMAFYLSQRGDSSLRSALAVGSAGHRWRTPARCCCWGCWSR